MRDDEWTVVGRKGKRARHRASAQPHGATRAGDDEPVAEDRRHCSTAEQCAAHLLNLQTALSDCAFTQSLKQAFADISEQFATTAGSHPENTTSPTHMQLRLPWAAVTSVRCYGLGSPTQSLNARAQLALLAILKTWLPESAQVTVFDPVLDETDTSVITQLGYHTMTEAEAAQHRADEPTLFYMPHCDASLYDSVLDANWSPALLKNVMVLGNSFEAMHERWTGPTFRRRAGRPGRVLALVDHSVGIERPLQGTGFRVGTAFNDTSLHAFEHSELDSVPALFTA